MKKLITMMCLLFVLAAPLKFALNYVVSFGTCIVDYGTDWANLTSKTAKCAWNHVTLQAV